MCCNRKLQGSANHFSMHYPRFSWPYQVRLAILLDAREGGGGTNLFFLSFLVKVNFIKPKTHDTKGRGP